MMCDDDIDGLVFAVTGTSSNEMKLNPTSLLQFK
jgi:hypothetical protein